MAKSINKIKGKGVLRYADGTPIPQDHFENEPSERMRKVVEKEHKDLDAYAKEMGFDWY